MKNIILTGFMGTGKTKVGELLAEKLNYSFVDLDSLVEKREGKKISQIFSEKGEDYFRQKEREALKEALEGQKGKQNQAQSQRKGQVISTGGGVLLREENRRLMEEKGTLICLKASPEEIYLRIRGSQERPLLEVEDPLEKIRELLKERKELYEKIPISLSTDGKSPEQVAGEIISIINKEFSNSLSNNNHNNK